MKTRTPVALDYSPMKVQRSRQFSQIRQGHTNRPKTSNLTTQRKPNDSRRQAQPTRNNDKLSKFDANAKSQVSLSPAKVLCVGCFNKQLHEAKVQKKRQQNSLIQPTSLSLINVDDPSHNQAKSRYNKELERTNMYNKELMMKNRQKTERQRQEKQRSVIENQQLVEENREMQRKRAEMQHERVEQLRKELRQQIEKKKQKDEQYKNQLKQPIDGIFGEPNKAIIQQQMQEKYKKDLKDQIAKNKQIRQTRQQEQNQRKKEAEARMLLEAAERQKFRKQKNEARQKMIENDYRKHKEYEEMVSKKRRNQEIQQEQLARESFNQYMDEKKHLDDLKRKKIDKYVEDLKKQMAIDEAKKKKEYSWLNEPTKTAFIEKDPVPERNCDSCEKRYPQSYLTKITEPLKF